MEATKELTKPDALRAGVKELREEIRGLENALDNLNYTSGLLNAEVESLRAENARAKRLLADIWDHARSIPMGEVGSDQFNRIEAIIDASSPARRAALAGSR